MWTELPPIVESEPVNESIEDFLAAREPSPAQSVASSASGLSDHVVEDLRANSDGLRRSFEDLYDYAVPVLRRINRSIQQDGTVESIQSDLGQHASHIKNFEDVFDLFAGVLPFIRPVAVERALLDEERHLIDEVLWIGNLAKFMLDLARCDANAIARHATLQRLDNLFPQDLVSTAGGARETDLDATLDMALAIRTQVAIALLRTNLVDNDVDEDPDNILKEVFLDSEGQTLKSWSGAPDFLDVDGALDVRFSEKAMRRVKNISGCFPRDDASLQRGDYVDWERLEDAYSWEGFMKEANVWVATRQKELLESVERKGGVSGIREDLNTAIDQNDLHNAALEVPAMSELDKNVFLGQILKRLSDTGSRVPLPASSAFPTAEPPSTTLAVRNEVASPQVLTRHHPERNLTNASNNIQVKQAPKRSLFDRQPNAERVADIDDFADIVNIEDGTQKVVRQTSEAARSMSAQMPASQDDFEKDTRPTNTTAHRVREATRARVEVPQSAQVPEEADELSEDDPQSAARQAGSSSQRQTANRSANATARRPAKRPAPAQEEDDTVNDATFNNPRDDDARDNDEESTDGQFSSGYVPRYTPNDQVPDSGTYAALQRNAKRAKISTEPQKKIPWQPEETNALIHYITEIGTSWSEIMRLDKREFQILQSKGRGPKGQVKLKDKARNLKYDLLK